MWSIDGAVVRRAGLAVLFAVGLGTLALPGHAAAQDDRVYSPAEVTSPPAIKSPNAAASAIQRSLPAALASVGGRVQLRMVVNADGKVDASTIEVVAASASALGEAARKAVERIEFTPAQVDGRAVRAVVMFPIVYAGR